jgi:hypothetical protein
MTVPGLRGCGEVDIDSASDEVPDCDDECHQDPPQPLWQESVAVEE